ncbi:GNAT family N-acetyltransferase [Stappia stellulata]|uniref:GNAT family N-acetyltransferase n=1 Tax=Stappia stellulata TaxID=71235 RepID=UPI000404A14D|nr:GNAT family N-acetyltransferase [Stappia stellulata]
MNGTTTVTFTAAQAGEHLPAWSALADVAVEPNPFFRPDFLLPYLAHMEHREVAICAVRSNRDGALLALAPVARRRLGFALAGAALHAGEYGPLGTPLIAPQADSDTLTSLLDTAAARFGTDLVTLPYLRTDGPVYDMLLDLAETSKWRVAREAVSLRAGHATGQTGQEQYGLLGRRRRKEIGRQLRRLSETGETRFTSLTAPADTCAAFEDFLALEARGWKGRRGTALACDPGRMAFARAFIADMAQAGRLRIDRLDVDDVPVAIMIMLRDSHRAWSWKIAHDEQLARFSPGAQVTRYAMRRDLEEPDLAEADSLAVPDHPMITPLWRGQVPYTTVLLARGAFAGTRLSLAQADHALARGLHGLAKSALRRLRSRARREDAA